MAKTRSVGFHRRLDGQGNLMAINPGIDVAIALDSAYAQLDIAEELAAQLSEPGVKNAERLGHACAGLIEMAKATVYACLEGLQDEKEAAHG